MAFGRHLMPQESCLCLLKTKITKKKPIKPVEMVNLKKNKITEKDRSKFEICSSLRNFANPFPHNRIGLLAYRFEYVVFEKTVFCYRLIYNILDWARHNNMKLHEQKFELIKHLHNELPFLRKPYFTRCQGMQHSILWRVGARQRSWSRGFQ